MSILFQSDDSISEYFSLKEKQDPTILYKWECPVCSLRFKWDTQLRRHQDKLGHENPDRTFRRQKRGRKETIKTEFPCGCCGKAHSNKIDLLNHRQWCLNDPDHGSRARYYRSSWGKAIFECAFHEIPYYYSNLQQLQRHIATTHKQRSIVVAEIKQHTMPLKKTRMDDNLIERLNKQFVKYRRLTADQVERIARAKEISESTVRKYFRKYRMRQY